MGNFLRRRLFFGAQEDKEPRYDISGTYNQGANGTTTITISNGHWNIKHTSSGGNGTVYVLYNIPYAWNNTTKKVTMEVSNYNVISGSPANGQKIAYGRSTDNNDMSGSGKIYLQINLGNQISEQNFAFQNNQAVSRRLMFLVPYQGSAYEIEFDFKLKVGRKWIC